MNTGLQRRFQALPPFVQKASVSFGLRFGGLAIQFGISVMTARLLGAEAFGAFTFAFVWATLIGTLLSMGLGPLSIRELPIFIKNKDRGAALGFLLVMGLTIVVASILSGLLLAYLESRGIMTLAPGWVFVTIVAISHALVLSLSRVLNGFQIIVWPQFYETILRQIAYIALILMILKIGYSVTPPLLFQLYLVSSVPTLLALGFLLKRVMNQDFPKQARPKATPMLWYGASLPMLFTAFSGFFNSNIDTLMIGGMLGDLEVGIYRAAVRGALLVSIANTVSIQVLGPMLSRALAEGDDAKAQKFLAYGAGISFATGLALCLLLGLGSTVFLGLFGPEFPQSATAMRLLLLGQGVNVLAGGSSILLVLMRRERVVLVVNLIGLFLNVVLNYLLINSMGINGAAIATAITTGFVAMTLLMMVLRQGRFDPTVFSSIGLMRARSRS